MLHYHRITQLNVDALRKMRIGKLVGNDDILIGIWKCGEERVFVWPTKLFRGCFDA